MLPKRLLLQVFVAAVFAADIESADCIGTDVSWNQKNSFVQVAQLIGKHLCILVLHGVEILHGSRRLAVGAETPAASMFGARS